MVAKVIGMRWSIIFSIHKRMSVHYQWEHLHHWESSVALNVHNHQGSSVLVTLYLKIYSITGGLRLLPTITSDNLGLPFIVRYHLGHYTIPSYSCQPWSCAQLCMINSRSLSLGWPSSSPIILIWLYTIGGIICGYTPSPVIIFAWTPSVEIICGCTQSLPIICGCKLSQEIICSFTRVDVHHHGGAKWAQQDCSEPVVCSGWPGSYWWIHIGHGDTMSAVKVQVVNQKCSWWA